MSWITPSRRTRIYERDGWRCVYCGVQVHIGDERSLRARGLPIATLDHVNPRANGGTSESENLVTACSDCNGGKGAGKVVKSRRRPVRQVLSATIAELVALKPPKKESIMERKNWNVDELLQRGRQIWGSDRLLLNDIVVRLGVGVGDLCRIARGATKDRSPENVEELKKELGNVIASTVRWCDDLGLDPNECIELGLQSQEKFARENPRR